MELGRTRLLAWVCGALLVAAAPVHGRPPDTPKPAAAAGAPAAAPTPPPAPGETPKIAFDKTEVDLGDIVRGNDAVATFTYHNTGTAPLHILSAKPG